MYILQYWRLGVAVSDKWEGWQGRYEHRYKMIGSMHATFYRRYRRRGPELVTGEEEIVANSDIGLEKWAARLCDVKYLPVHPCVARCVFRAGPDFKSKYEASMHRGSRWVWRTRAECGSVVEPRYVGVLGNKDLFLFPCAQIVWYNIVPLVFVMLPDTIHLLSERSSRQDRNVFIFDETGLGYVDMLAGQ